MFWLLTFFFLVIAGLTPAAAMESAPVVSKRATVTLVTDTDSVTPGSPFGVALRLRLADGWHTYWKNPGDAGVPPEFTLDPPPAAISGIDWPTPARIAEGDVMTYGYVGEVLLPARVTLAPGGTVVQAHANWLVCKDICVPEEGDFRLELKAGPSAPSAQAPLFAAHAARTPRPSPWAATISSDGTLAVRGPELTAATVAEAWFIPDRTGQIQDSAPQRLTLLAGGFDLALRGTAPASPLTGVLSVRDRAGTQTDVVLAASPGSPVAAETMPLIEILGFAFLGGLILNLMPCVFPVLAMKAVAMARGAAHGTWRGHALSYTAGVLVTFGLLSGLLLGARAAGMASGWGFQFASPAFVAAMAWLLFVVGLNLSGVFQIGGAAVTNLGGGLVRPEGRLGNMWGGHAGSFFTGLLAVLVATPCTAPFMGAAIAGGLAAPPPVTILVFLVMGLGLASPYLALAAVPGLGRRLPRPGAWMEIMKQVLAFPMYGAAVWLLWVVSQQTGSDGMLMTAVGCVLLGFAAWALGLSQTMEGRTRHIGQSAAAFAVIATLALLAGIGAAPYAATAAADPSASGAEPLTAGKLAALRADNRPVFVNVTAAWCVTCLVNERVALNTGAVRAAFAARHVAYLKGDWTRQDPALTAFLRENGRDGVPLYLYFPPSGGAPERLPQILTEGTVLAALESGGTIRR